jgi:hypothetical protein
LRLIHWTHERVVMRVIEQEGRPKLLPVVGVIFVMYVCILGGGYVLGNFVF